MQLSKESEKICAALGELFAAAGETLYLVGGAVRDRLLGRGDDGDLDFTTSAAPDAIARIVRPVSRACYDKSRAKGYGTCGVLLKSGPEVEITPYRMPGATPETAADLEQDLHGRDFTINAVAVDVTPKNFGAVVDPCSGEADLKSRVLRTPVAPDKTFGDDPLRLLRAVRFAAAFGLEIEAQTFETIKQLAAARPCALERVSTERVREELLHMLQIAPPSGAFELLRGAGLLAVALPEVQALVDLQPEPDSHHKDNFEHTLQVLDTLSAEGHGNDPILMFAALAHDAGKPDARRQDETGAYSFPEHDKIGEKLAAALCERLRFSNAQGARIRRLVRLHHRVHPYSEEWTDSAVRRAVNELGEHFDDVLALAHADITTSDPEKMKHRRAALGHFTARVETLDRETALNPQPPIDGNEIMALLGLDRGGPEVGLAVKYLKEQIVAGTLGPGDAQAARDIVSAREWQNK